MSSSKLNIYNTLTRKTEVFEPIAAPFVGIYLCGPTVYGEPHLGHVRGPVTFDILNRYLLHLGYKVRFVRNITDVGHLTDDSDDGDDKILKKAILEKLEPMEIAQKYTYSYHSMLNSLNVLPAGIEPRASGHIIEQISMIETLIEKGYAYESHGSVYFDVSAYSKNYQYGELSGRITEELLAGSSRRTLEGQEEKRSPNDFALWKKADKNHIMKWPSPWGEGFPGWHIECSAMSKKYLGEQFDIHGGGMDLLFPHHESEIAQSKGCTGHTPAKYWVHHNMITINGQKMAKSLNNGILVKDFFTGNHPLLERAYSPMNLKFFILQAHYRGTLDFSNEALQAADKGLERLITAMNTLQELKPSRKGWNADLWKQKCYDALNDDLNTPILIAHLFDAVKAINSIKAGLEIIDESDLDSLKKHFPLFVTDILGLQNTAMPSANNKENELIELLIHLRAKAKTEKNYALSDEIRNQLSNLGIELKDSKEGTTFSKK
ncbi:MAG: cysteine--tRNA ligase [Bacteroidetes bacterium]|nr:cysteine--tRNA ligase [Bacteroidota bacterium]